MNNNQITQLLDAARAGDANARDLLLPRMYDELHVIARRHMRNENAGHTLQATALVNEAYLKLAGNQQVPENRAHFLALSAQAMRRILVDHARNKKREKRGGDLMQVTLTEWESSLSVTEDSILELDDALEKLAKFDERAEKAMVLMYFGGMTYEEIAKSLNVGRSTVFEDIKAAKAWLAVQMGGFN